MYGSQKWIDMEQDATHMRCNTGNSSSMLGKKTTVWQQSNFGTRACRGCDLQFLRYSNSTGPGNEQPDINQPCFEWLVNTDDLQKSISYILGLCKQINLENKKKMDKATFPGKVKTLLLKEINSQEYLMLHITAEDEQLLKTYSCFLL